MGASPNLLTTCSSGILHDTNERSNQQIYDRQLVYTLYLLGRGEFLPTTWHPTFNSIFPLN
jgi:hypothetical protein